MIQRWVRPLLWQSLLAKTPFLLSGHLLLKDPLSPTLSHGLVGFVTSSVVLSPTACDYTIRGLNSNTAYSGTVEVHSLANNATVSWNAHTLSQGKPELPSSVLRCRPFDLSLSCSSTEGKSTHWEVSSNVTATIDVHPNFPLCALPAKMIQLLHMCK